MPVLVDGFKVIISMDVISKFQSVLLRGTNIAFCNVAVAVVSAAKLADSIRVEDKATFDGQRWEVSWRWRGTTPVLVNKVAKYEMSDAAVEKFD